MITNNDHNEQDYKHGNILEGRLYILHMSFMPRGLGCPVDTSLDFSRLDSLVDLINLLLCQLHIACCTVFEGPFSMSEGSKSFQLFKGGKNITYDDPGRGTTWSPSALTQARLS